MSETAKNEGLSQGAYFEEKSLIKNQIGSLEEIRKELGLSKRKMCQLLLVDPSAWTKWSKPGNDAPAYIYRSLQWALAIIQEYPETHPLALQLLRQKSEASEASAELSQKFESRLQLHKSILFDLDTKLTKLDSEKGGLKRQNALFKSALICLGLVNIGLIVGLINIFL